MMYLINGPVEHLDIEQSMPPVVIENPILNSLFEEPRNERDRVGSALFHQEPPLRSAEDRQNRREGHQPLRRRSLEGLSGLEPM